MARDRHLFFMLETSSITMARVLLFMMGQKKTDPSSGSVLWLIVSRGHAQSMQIENPNKSQREKEREVMIYVSTGHACGPGIRPSGCSFLEVYWERKGSSMLFPLICRRYEGIRNLKAHTLKGQEKFHCWRRLTKVYLLAMVAGLGSNLINLQHASINQVSVCHIYYFFLKVILNSLIVLEFRLFVNFLRVLF